MFDVDIVYTWVDGSDTNHVKMRNKYRKQSRHHMTSASSARWRNTDELKYSIQSVLQYMPWVRKIFVIVSFRQRPKWTIDDDRIEFVDDEYLYGTKWADHLPTFNSHSIESHICHIPDLKEHFMYFCDDMFVGSPCEKTDFFTEDGKIKFFPGRDLVAGRPGLHVEGWAAARMNNNTLLNRLFGRKLRRSDSIHQARPALKSVLEFCWSEERLRPYMQRTSSARFRSPTDIEPVGLSIHLALNSSLAVVSSISQKYIALSDMGYYKLEQKFYALLFRKPKLYCINDNMRFPPKKLVERIRLYYATMLPHNHDYTTFDDRLDKVRKRYTATSRWLMMPQQFGTPA